MKLGQYIFYCCQLCLTWTLQAKITATSVHPGNAAQAKKRILIPRPRALLGLSRPGLLNGHLPRRLVPGSPARRVSLRKPDGSFYGYHEEAPLQRKIEHPAPVLPLPLSYTHPKRIDIGEFRPEHTIKDSRWSNAAHAASLPSDGDQARASSSVRQPYLKGSGLEGDEGASHTDSMARFSYQPQKTNIRNNGEKNVAEPVGDSDVKAHDLSRGSILPSTSGNSMMKNFYHGLRGEPVDTIEMGVAPPKPKLLISHRVPLSGSYDPRLLQRPYDLESTPYVTPLTQHIHGLHSYRNDYYTLGQLPVLPKESVTTTDDMPKLGGIEKLKIRLKPIQTEDEKEEREQAKASEKEESQKQTEKDTAADEAPDKESNKEPIGLPPKQPSSPLSTSTNFPGALVDAKEEADKAITKDEGKEVIKPIVELKEKATKLLKPSKQKEPENQTTDKTGEEKTKPKTPHEDLKPQKTVPPKKEPVEAENVATEKEPPSLKPSGSEETTPTNVESQGSDGKVETRPMPVLPTAPSPPPAQSCPPAAPSCPTSAPPCSPSKPATPTIPDNTEPSPIPVSTCSTDDNQEVPEPTKTRPATAQPIGTPPVQPPEAPADGNPEFDKMSRAVYQVLDEMAFEGGSHMVEIKSSGCDDPPANGNACEESVGSIKFDGEELSKGVVGFNLVVMSYPDLVVKYTVGYQTGLVAEDSQRMARFLMDLKGDNVIFLASKGDSSAAAGQEVYDALTLFGLRSPFMRVPRSSLAFVGCRGDCSGPWVQQVQRKPKEGPSVISLVIGPQDEFVSVGGGGSRMFEITKHKAKAGKDMDSGYNAGENLAGDKEPAIQQQPPPQQVPSEQQQPAQGTEEQQTSTQPLIAQPTAQKKPAPPPQEQKQPEQEPPAAQETAQPQPEQPQPKPPPKPIPSKKPPPKEQETTEKITAEQQQTEPPPSESTQTETTQAEQPQIETPQTETPQTEPPQKELPQKEPPPKEPPLTEPPQKEPPQTEPPQKEPVQTEPAQTEPPQTEEPQTEPPQVEQPQTEAPSKQPVTATEEQSKEPSPPKATKPLETTQAEQPTQETQETQEQQQTEVTKVIPQKVEPQESKAETQEQSQTQRLVEQEQTQREEETTSPQPASETEQQEKTPQTTTTTTATQQTSSSIDTVTQPTPPKSPEAAHITHSVTVHESATKEGQKVQVEEMIHAKGKPQVISKPQTVEQNEEEAEGLTQGPPGETVEANAVTAKVTKTPVVTPGIREKQVTQAQIDRETNQQLPATQAKSQHGSYNPLLYDGFDQKMYPVTAADHASVLPTPEVGFITEDHAVQLREEPPKLRLPQRTVSPLPYAVPRIHPQMFAYADEQKNSATIGKLVPSKYQNGGETVTLYQPVSSPGKVSTDTELKSNMESKMDTKDEGPPIDLTKNVAEPLPKFQASNSAFLEPQVDDMGTEAEADNEPLADNIVNSTPLPDALERAQLRKDKGKESGHVKDTIHMDTHSVKYASKKPLKEKQEALMKFFRPDVGNKPIVVSHQDIEAAVREEDSISEPAPGTPLPIKNPQPPKKLLKELQAQEEEEQEVQNTKIKKPYLSGQSMKPKKEGQVTEKGKDKGSGPLFEIQKTSKARKNKGEQENEVVKEPEKTLKPIKEKEDDDKKGRGVKGAKEEVSAIEESPKEDRTALNEDKGNEEVVAVDAQPDQNAQALTSDGQQGTDMKMSEGSGHALAGGMDSNVNNDNYQGHNGENMNYNQNGMNNAQSDGGYKEGMKGSSETAAGFMPSDDTAANAGQQQGQPENMQGQMGGDVAAGGMPPGTPAENEAAFNEDKKKEGEDFSNKLPDGNTQAYANNTQPDEAAFDNKQGNEGNSVENANNVDEKGSKFTQNENVGGSSGNQQSSQSTETKKPSFFKYKSNQGGQGSQGAQGGQGGGMVHHFNFESGPGNQFMNKIHPHRSRKAFLKREQANLDRLQKIMEGIEMLQKIDPVEATAQLKDADMVPPRKPYVKVKIKGQKLVDSDGCPHGSLYKRDSLKGAKKGKGNTKHLTKKDCMPIPHVNRGHGGLSNDPYSSSDNKESFTSVKLQHEYQGLPGEQAGTNPPEVSFYFGNNDRDRKEGEMLLKTKDNVFADGHSNVFDNGDYLRAAENMLQTDYRMAYKEAKAAFDKSTREVQKKLGDNGRVAVRYTKRHLPKKKGKKQPLLDISTERFRRVMPVKKHTKPPKKPDHKHPPPGQNWIRK